MSANPPITLVAHELSFRYDSVGQVEAMHVYTRRCEFPIGFIHYNQPITNYVCIGYIFVHECYRRQGLATRMLKKLKEWYPGTIIYTGRGNEFSTPWLEEMGFVKEPAGWFLRPPTIEPCPMI